MGVLKIFFGGSITRLYSLIFLVLSYGCLKKRECDPTKINVSINSPYDSSFFSKLHDIDSLVGLSDIRCSSDSIELRINFYYGNFKSKKLLVFRSNKGVSDGKYFILSIDQVNGKPVLENKKELEIYPTCGWRNFFDTITNKGILTFKTDNEIPNWRIGVHDRGWIVRYKFKDRIRVYSHYSFSGNAKYHQEAEAVLEIIGFLERQLDLKITTSK